MKLPGIRLVPVELEIRGKAPAQTAKTFQQLFAAGPSGHGEFPGIKDMDLDVIALLEFQRLDHGGGKANRETVPPLSDLHGDLHGYTNPQKYIKKHAKLTVESSLVVSRKYPKTQIGTADGYPKTYP
jgi:hypothetical protein